MIWEIKRSSKTLSLEKLKVFITLFSFTVGLIVWIGLTAPNTGNHRFKVQQIVQALILFMLVVQMTRKNSISIHEMGEK